MSIRTKRIVYTAISISIIIVIFSFSGQDADKSNELSRGLLKKLIDFMFFLSDSAKEYLLENAHKLVRKAAHFTEFALLGGSLYLTFGVWYLNFKYKPYILSALGCLLVAVCDEMIQQFSGGRAPGVVDVIIDFSGGACVLLIIALINLIINKKSSATI